jgi:DNA-binding transcriptional MerR regulator
MEARANLVAGSDYSSSGEYSIGQLAREFNVTPRALRFYEDRELLSPRRRGSARYFSSGDRAALAKILKAKQLGFTLSEIKSMLAGKDDDPGCSAISLPVSAIEEQISHLEQQEHDICTALAELQALREKMTTRTA